MASKQKAIDGRPVNNAVLHEGVWYGCTTPYNGTELTEDSAAIAEQNN